VLFIYLFFTILRGGAGLSEISTKF
jgi:hypothetical protein